MKGRLPSAESRDWTEIGMSLAPYSSRALRRSWPSCEVELVASGSSILEG